MSSDTDYEKVNELLGYAEDAMEELEEKYDSELNIFPRGNSMMASWTGEDGLDRNVNAYVDPDSYEMEVEYNAWIDRDVEGTSDMVRYWTHQEVATIADPTDELGEAVEKAYEESLDVDDEDLGEPKVLEFTEEEREAMDI